MAVDKTTFRQIESLFHKHQKFLLATHLQPDGDAIGSLLGLGLALIDMGKEVQMSWAEEGSEVPPQYAFLPSINKIVTPKQINIDFDCIISLDCANTDRLGELESLVKSSRCLVNLDHHPQNSMFAKINLVDETFSSCAEILFVLFRALKIKITPDIGQCLYTGIVTDTGRFQYNNTNRRVFETAARLVELGVNPNQIFQEVYENASFPSLKLLGSILTRSKLLPDKKIVYTVLTDEDLAETGALLTETENFIDYLRSVKGVRLAVLFKQSRRDGLRVSLRSKNKLDVGAIARSFNGGGHYNAAGFTSSYSIEETIDKIVALMEKQG